MGAGGADLRIPDNVLLSGLAITGASEIQQVSIPMRKFSEMATNDNIRQEGLGLFAEEI